MKTKESKMFLKNVKNLAIEMVKMIPLLAIVFLSVGVILAMLGVMGIEVWGLLEQYYDWRKS